MKSKAIFTLVLLVLCGVGLNACSNTVQGVGRDISHAGDKIQGAVN